MVNKIIDSDQMVDEPMYSLLGLKKCLMMKYGIVYDYVL